MYKNYDVDDFINVVDACADRMRRILLNYLGEVEGLRWQINDRYPFSDLPLRWEETENQEEMIKHLLIELNSWAKNRKVEIIEDSKPLGKTANQEYGHINCNEHSLIQLADWIEGRPSIDDYFREETASLYYRWSCIDTTIDLDLPLTQSQLKCGMLEDLEQLK